ncbi:PREDICTED: uncharacterized protein LOC103068823 [Lipotes vexillifer]|uniref:Uncharacterized protein LOC103068823 n=1 Tax=Lipotes vexillifer TaxID=118797 RepID=A0A340XUV3_LIPVE|nr:PREDICTED: uncharacterized protein LOC103068823 [Lipotes vexillifer]
MILATQARSQWTWFQRITQEFHKRICLFYTGLIILLLEIAVVAFFADHLPFSLSMTIIASGIVFILISGGMVLYGLCRNPEYAPLRPEESTMIVTGIVFFFLTGLMYLHEANKVSAFIQEKFSRSRSARDPSRFQRSLKIQLLPLALAFHETPADFHVHTGDPPKTTGAQLMALLTCNAPILSMVLSCTSTLPWRNYPPPFLGGVDTIPSSRDERSSLDPIHHSRRTSSRWLESQRLEAVEIMGKINQRMGEEKPAGNSSQDGCVPEPLGPLLAPPRGPSPAGTARLLQGRPRSPEPRVAAARPDVAPPPPPVPTLAGAANGGLCRAAGAASGRQRAPHGCSGATATTGRKGKLQASAQAAAAAVARSSRATACPSARPSPQNEDLSVPISVNFLLGTVIAGVWSSWKALAGPESLCLHPDWVNFSGVGGFEVPTCLSQLHVFFRAQPRASVAVLDLLARAVRNCSVDRNSGSEPAWPARPLPGCVILDYLRHFSVLPFPLKYLPRRVLRRIR